MQKQENLKTSLICNAAIVVLTIAAILINHLGVGDWAETFRYFTTDSNILCALSAAVLFLDGLHAKKENRTAFRPGVILFKYISTVSVTITFLTVIAFLGPVYGYASMFINGSIYLHGVGPILAMISFWFFDKGYVLKKTDLWFGMSTVVIYGIIYYLCVMQYGVWEDFYSFTAMSAWYVAAIAMAAACLLVSIVLRVLHNKQEKKA